MSALKCIKCQHDIATSDVNVAADLAKCARCGSVFKASDALDTDIHSEVDLAHPPNGVWFAKSPMGFELTATTRSVQAIFLVPFSFVWIGFSMSGLYIAPLLSGKGFSFTYIFGLPFLVASIFLGWKTLMTLIGTVRVRANGYDGEVFTGIGPIGRTRRFSWRDVKRVTTSNKSRFWGRGTEDVISLEGKEFVSFGGDMTDERRYFVAMALQKLLLQLKR
ncbi:hypothetical protein [Pacificispira sp.]|uniref:hypothetical protein n=1 Tax=Pacificispira sp. TaxID=2888761 RepID=UPI003BAA11D1